MTRPTVGGYNWRDELDGITAREEAVLRLLKRLEQMARNDKTRAEILAAQTLCLENKLGVMALRNMEERQ